MCLGYGGRQRQTGNSCCHTVKENSEKVFVDAFCYDLKTNFFARLETGVWDLLHLLDLGPLETDPIIQVHVLLT